MSIPTPRFNPYHKSIRLKHGELEAEAERYRAGPQPPPIPPPMTKEQEAELTARRERMLEKWGRVYAYRQALWAKTKAEAARRKAQLSSAVTTTSTT